MIIFIKVVVNLPTNRREKYFVHIGEKPVSIQHSNVEIWAKLQGLKLKINAPANRIQYRFQPFVNKLCLNNKQALNEINKSIVQYVASTLDYLFNEDS